MYARPVKHTLIDPTARNRRKSDHKLWERSRSMEPRQLETFGGVELEDGWKVSIVSGSDDH